MQRGAPPQNRSPTSASPCLSIIRHISDETGFPAWAPLTLDRGLAGIAVMFHSSASEDPARLHHAHRHLTEMVQECKGRKQTMGGLYFGVGALAFATSVAHGATGGYRGPSTRSTRRSAPRSAS
ncbi:lanthionine synthetase LanC family protein [Streptomyces sp. NPDC002181]|uniref:lanthionine synthetase LanC family protein n=1 Tax=Streptomyces sp. NPDC002181 TaxID=3364635 RepID=UPI00369B8B84